jgi:hypothetical protein
MLLIVVLGYMLRYVQGLFVVAAGIKKLGGLSYSMISIDVFLFWSDLGAVKIKLGIGVRLGVYLLLFNSLGISRRAFCPIFILLEHFMHCVRLPALCLFPRSAVVLKSHKINHPSTSFTGMPLHGILRLVNSGTLLNLYDI